MSKHKVLELVRRALYVIIPLGWMIAHGVMLARADVVCVRNGDGSWTCSGDGGGSSTNNPHATVCATNYVITFSPAVGNLASVSVEDCEAFKQRIQEFNAYLDVLPSNFEFYEQTWDDAWYQFSDLFEEDSNEHLLLNQLSDAYWMFAGEGWFFFDQALNIYSIADELDCSTCPLTSTTETSVNCVSCYGSNDVGGGGGSTNSSSCSSCPCSALLNSILTEVTSIRSKLEQTFEKIKIITDNVAAIRNAFYGHTGIKVTSSDGSWTNIYNTGIANGFNYANSNVLERIELLLYSLTALNQENESTNLLDNASSKISDLQSSLDDGFQESETLITSSRDSFLSLKNNFQQMFNLFQPLGSSSFQPNQVVPHTDFELGNSSFTVPGLTLNGFTGSSVPSYIEFLRHTIQVAYLLASLFFVWRFYCFFFSKTTTFLKWASEIVNGLFG